MFLILWRVSLFGIANLTDLDNLYVSKVVQDAYVKINEEGRGSCSDYHDVRTVK